MRRLAAFAVVALALFISQGAWAAPMSRHEAEAVLFCLQEAYPDFAASLAKGEHGQWLLQTDQGNALLDDGQERSGEALQENPSIADTLTIPYEAGAGGRNPVTGADPGRARNLALLKILYGEKRREIESGLESVDFLGTSVSFSKRHGAAAALARVASTLREACENDPTLREWLLPVAGHYFWRTIEGTKRLSAHSFGIAIDLNMEKGIYWRWKPAPKVLEATREHYPQVIVDAFEAEGFVWGGKWSHFDFMHFEYRPEILAWNKRAK